jgi:hypothetical protein
MYQPQQQVIRLPLHIHVAAICVTLASVYYLGAALLGEVNAYMRAEANKRQRMELNKQLDEWDREREKAKK